MKKIFAFVLLPVICYLMSAVPAFAYMGAFVVGIQSTTHAATWDIATRMITERVALVGKLEIRSGNKQTPTWYELEIPANTVVRAPWDMYVISELQVTVIDNQPSFIPQNVDFSEPVRLYSYSDNGTWVIVSEFSHIRRGLPQ